MFARQISCCLSAGNRYGRSLNGTLGNDEIYRKDANRALAPGRAIRLVVTRLPELWLAFALEIERHCSADQILQGRFIKLVAFVNIDGAPDISLEAGVE